MGALQNLTYNRAASDVQVKLRCTRCGADLRGLECAVCRFQMRLSSGIIHTLSPERIAYYARFVGDYERIRAAEGRGSQDEDFYLGLPYKDATGRNSGQWKIRARSYDYLIRRVLKSQDNCGTILDLGAGNCWMSFRLALAGYQPVAVDLLANERDGLAAAVHYQKHLSKPFPRYQAELTRLPFQDGQFDAIVFNASFHYAEDYAASLREALRCLKSGGMAIISDTPWYSQEESGWQMVSERRSTFLQRYGTASDSIHSLEFLTDERLRTLEKQLSIQWAVHCPWYGIKWAVRPFMAQLRHRREPSRFRIYVARKDA